MKYMRIVVKARQTCIQLVEVFIALAYINKVF